MKLIPLSDFVLERVDKISALDLANQVVAYTKFLKQPLTLGMFVPVDEEGNIMKDPEFYEHYKNSGFPLTGNDITQKQSDKAKEFFKAKEKVLFEGFEIGKSKVGLKINHYLQNSKIDILIAFKINSDVWEFNRGLACIEDLCSHELELTPSALEAIGINE